MGKKDKNKKGKGAEKTALKTEKKLKQKVKKETGEDDIESIVKAIEEEEKKRKEVKEMPLKEPPSHRSNFSMTPHSDNPEIIFFGGEFYNGQKTLMFNDLIFYNIKRKEWSQVKSPGGPPSRCSHQAVMTSASGGQLWIFGGEYASPSETQFYHYKDLWCYHFVSKRWEKIGVSGGPTARSGHRMALFKRHLVIFGGFHDNLRDCKYFNDVHAFDLDNLKWKKLEISGSGPSPRSGCIMFVSHEGRIVVFGGYCKEKGKGKKETEKGTALTDMFILVPDKHDESLTKWRWHSVKQVGNRPTTRTGMSVATAPNSNKVYVFGGVQDIKDEDEDLEGQFFNEIYHVNIENEKATWSKVQLTGKRDVIVKKRRKNEGEDSQVEDQRVDQQLDDLNLEEVKGEKDNTVTVEEGAFTITSTVSDATHVVDCDIETEEVGGKGPPAVNQPCPRFSSGLAYKSGNLFLFGGMLEEGDVTYTLKDFYSLDTHKMEEWETLVENDLKSMEWFESDSSSEGDTDEEEDMEED